MKHYDHDFICEAIDLAKNLGCTKAAQLIKIPYPTLVGWVNAYTSSSTYEWGKPGWRLRREARASLQGYADYS